MSRRAHAGAPRRRAREAARPDHAFARVEDAIEAFRAGRMIIVVDIERLMTSEDMELVEAAAA